MTTKILTTIAAGSLLLGTLTPIAFADTTTQVAGNGAFSTSNVTTNNSSNTNVTQNNSATVTNNVTSNSNTGNNTADYNTGGSAGIDTGSATSNVSVDTKANVNEATVGCPSCNTGGNNSVAVLGNGYGSDNHVNANSNNNTNVTQNNNANITNNVRSNQNTGNNDASGNTGWVGGNGNVQITTGSADSSTDISNAANANIANVGGNGDGNLGNGSSVVSVVGNGAFSNNSVDVSNNNSATVNQDNHANVRNNVRSNNNTGDNTADFNTGGSADINTGDASDQTRIRNAVNFNAADLGCDCVTVGNQRVDVSGNGYSSDNTVHANTDNNTDAFQNNWGTLSNYVTPHVNTGRNDSTGNTGWQNNGATAVLTGSGYSTTDLSNATGENLFGQGVSVPFPGGFNLNFGFDLGSLFNGMF